MSGQYSPSAETMLDLKLLLLAEHPSIPKFAKERLRNIALHVGALEREHKILGGIAGNALRQIYERATP